MSLPFFFYFPTGDEWNAKFDVNIVLFCGTYLVMTTNKTSLPDFCCWNSFCWPICICISALGTQISSSSLSGGSLLFSTSSNLCRPHTPSPLLDPGTDTTLSTASETSNFYKVHNWFGSGGCASETRMILSPDSFCCKLIHLLVHIEVRILFVHPFLKSQVRKRVPWYFFLHFTSFMIPQSFPLYICRKFSCRLQNLSCVFDAPCEFPDGRLYN